MRRIVATLSVLFVSLLFAGPAFSHCEIPCGIYGDEIRFDMMEENIITIEKSMKMIVKLSKEKEINYNQLVRWVNNKENHASEIQHIVFQYFMTQRITPVSKNHSAEHNEYINQLTLLHEMLVYAMKAKQTTDLGNVEKLRSLLADFRTIYFGKKHSH